MTIGEYIKQQPETIFSIEYYFENYCKECGKSWLELDEEYSFDLVAADIGETGYDWIFENFDTDDRCVEITETKITITVEDTTGECICDDCKIFNDELIATPVVDYAHKTAYKRLMHRMGNYDVYHKALAYLITADSVCRNHINNIYDFSERCIIPGCLNEGWQTGTSLKTCRLAFNLYNGGLGWCDEDDRSLVTPAEIFCCSLAPFYWEAVKLRYPEYTEE